MTPDSHRLPRLTHERLGAYRSVLERSDPQAIEHVALHLALAGAFARDRVAVLAALEARGCDLDGLRRTLERRDARRLRELGVRRPLVSALTSLEDADLDAERRRVERAGAHLVPWGDPRIPDGFHHLDDPPMLLWVRGVLPFPDAVVCGVVGSRRETEYGRAAARGLARDLALSGLLVCSGGARGVDSLAHRAALDAGQPTVAVLGCGIDVAYPPENRKLFETIAERGCLVAESPCGSAPLPWRFPERNRLIAAWSRAVVVVEATLRSGSLITARSAAALGREVLAVPGPITSESSAGTNDLLREGVRPACSADDVLRALGVEPPPRDRSAGEADADPLVAALPVGRAVAPDEIRTELPIGALLGRLAALETQGLVERRPGGRWART